MLETTDADGTWRSEDVGVTWALVDPSQEWRDKQAIAAAKPAAPEDPEQAVEVNP